MPAERIEDNESASPPDRRPEAPALVTLCAALGLAVAPKRTRHTHRQGTVQIRRRYRRTRGDPIATSAANVVCVLHGALVQSWFLPELARQLPRQALRYRGPTYAIQLHLFRAHVLRIERTLRFLSRKLASLFAVASFAPGQAIIELIKLCTPPHVHVSDVGTRILNFLTSPSSAPCTHPAAVSAGSPSEPLRPR